MPRFSVLLSALLGALIAATSPARAHPEPPARPAEAAQLSRSTGPAKVVDAFHAALDRGDTAAAVLLADALVVFEGGEAERSKAEYAGHHLPADAVFPRAVGSQLTRRSGGASGDLAWVASEGRMRGRYKDRDVDRITTETMVLRRAAGGWKIVHAHWSSRAASPPR